MLSCRSATGSSLKCQVNGEADPYRPSADDYDIILFCQKTYPSLVVASCGHVQDLHLARYSQQQGAFDKPQGLSG